MAVVSSSEAFGPRVRSLRAAKGLTLTEFAGRLFYSKGHVSRVETGVQPPSREFARRCDAELGTGGELIALVAGVNRRSTGVDRGRGDQDDDQHDGIWVMTMAPDGGSSFTAVGRREMLLGGAALLARLGGGVAARPSAEHTGEYLEHHRRLFDSARRLGQVTPPTTVLPMVVGQAQALRTLAGQARGKDAAAVAALSARAAEFAGWMAQESGDDEAAEWWTGRAVAVAAEAGDPHTASYALVRRALITMYRGDAAATVGYAERAQMVPGTPARILGLAAQREAQGHALAGDYDACMRALDRAAFHLAAAAEEMPGEPVIGTTHIADPVAVVTGWCLLDLGRPEKAAAVLDREVARIPVSAVRARLRFGVRQALAHAMAGELEVACELAETMTGQAAAIGSATILADLRRLAATLRRWHTHPAVRALDPSFNAAFYRSA
ncbi:MAG: helix-turn-helix domain-containing protein [Saccharothrix sp.]|nr:helix-turn-helix domain-containing protein [Saccharothrix sp.]